MVCVLADFTDVAWETWLLDTMDVVLEGNETFWKRVRRGPLICWMIAVVGAAKGWRIDGLVARNLAHPVLVCEQTRNGGECNNKLDV